MYQHYSILRTRLLCAAFAFVICLTAALQVNAATYTVINTNNANTGSLRQAVLDANATTANDVIVFDIPAAQCNATTGVCTIALASQLEIANNGSLTINGTGANRLTIDGANVVRVFSIATGATATIRGVTATRGRTNGSPGGCIFSDGGSTLNLINSTVSNCVVVNSQGGGLYVLGNANITSSTVSGNTTPFNGGGIYFGSFSGGNPTWNVTNTTISDNAGGTVIADAGGGGIFLVRDAGNNSQGTLNLLNSTIAGNSNGVGGGVFNCFGAGGNCGTGQGSLTFTTLNSKNTIIAGNTANIGAAGGPDVRTTAAGQFTSQGYNLIGDTSAATFNTTTGDLVNTAAQLAPLAFNGGTTQTRVLCSASGVPNVSCTGASPAIDKGASGTTADGRGVIRPYDIFATANASGGNGSDIGAFELIPTSAFGWGFNPFGGLGDGTTDNRSLPTAIAGGFTDIVAVEGGQFHALALRSNGTLLAWGNNNTGQLGDGTTTQRNSPVIVMGGLTTVVATTGGQNHSLALLADGTIRAWGFNGNGQLGNGLTTDSSTPVTVIGISTAVAVAAGGQSSYALLADGSVKAWGANSSGQLGDGTNTRRLTSVQVLGLTAGVISIDGGGNSAYALLADGSVRTWGDNGSGQLGDGMRSARNTPFAPPNLNSNVVQIATGSSHGVALKADGTVLTWGAHGEGQLGNGTPAGTNNGTPTAISLANVVEIKCNSSTTTYARLRDGSLVAWGNNNEGEIGNGTSVPAAQTTPVAVSADTGISFFGAASFSGYAGSPLAPVAAGVNRFVRLGNATVNFPNVSTAGNLQIRTFDPTTTGLSVPTGFTLLTHSNGFDITSSAQFTGSASVCLKVPGVISATDFGKLFILHDDDGDGALDAVGTFSRDYRRREICRTTTSFSPFVLAINPATTAATATVGGRVTTASGTPIKGVRIIMTDAATSEQRTATSTAFGYYRFAEVATGETYIFTAASKRFSFAQPTQVRSVTAEVDDVNFTAQE